ncbi:MAG: hypothetical protein ACYC6Y_23665 [Thermoguttaceae bacterium]
MQSHRRQSAVSLATSAVAFALLGCAVAVCSLVAGVEPYVFWFGLATYAFITGPLFLAAAISRSTAPTGHRSFRVSSLSGVERRRVKRRLLWIAFSSFVLGITVMFLAFLAVISVAPQRGVWLVVTLYGVPVLVYTLTLLLSKTLCLRLGWMTEEEARPFPFGMRKNRWPASWLEPVGETDPADDADAD